MPLTPTQFSDQTPVRAGEESATDQLTRLPKMSPTAGVGTQDYVAISTAAVIASLLGFAAILALMNEELVLIPIVATIVAAAALRQIKHSNGTQTGAGVAMLGLFLGAAIASFVITSDVWQRLGRRADGLAINELCMRFGQNLHDRNFDAAYDLFSQRFKASQSRQEFVGRFRAMQDELTRESQSGGLGPISGARYSGLASFYTDADTGSMTAQGEIFISYEGAKGENVMGAVFRKAGTAWTIESLPDLIPVKPPQNSLQPNIAPVR